MPISSEAGKRFIKKIVKNLKHEKMLDIGCGCGTYAKLFPDTEWTGVEVWEPYVEKYDLKTLYKNFYIEDARTWTTTEHYDIAFAGDVLEHMTASEARQMLDKLRDCADTVIVSIPIGKWPQGTVEGNPYETHIKDDWTDEDIRSILGEPSLSEIECEIGVYVWSKFTIEVEDDSVPATIHIVWIGDESKRPDDCINTWKLFNPEWTIKVWGNKEYQETNWYNKDQMEHMWNRGLLYGVADMMRYEIIYNHGGFCVDADSVCVRALEDWLFETDITVAYENEKIKPGLVAIGYMAAIPQHPMFMNIIKEIHDDENVKVLEPWQATGPLRLTNNINYTYNLNIKIWPSHYFMPEYNTGERYTGDGPIFAEQKWSSTKEIYEKLGIHKQKKKLKIAIYTICKNEEHHVKRWAASNNEADLRIVCDTGSTDNTVNLLKEQGVTVYNISVNPWRFDVARNTGLNLLPEDVDICIWQDLDELLLPGWRQELDNNWKDNTTMVNHRYRNNGGPWQWHAKIHTRHNCVWKGPVHETLAWKTDDMWQDPSKILWLGNIYLDEYQDVGKDRSAYLKLLNLKILEGDHDWKTYYFLAIEYERQGKVEEAKATFIKAYERCAKENTVDLAYISKTIANLSFSLNDRKDTEDWFRVSTGHGAERESWFSFAHYCYKIEDWDRCYLASKKCLSISDHRDGYTQDPKAWGYMIYDIAALSAYNIGLYKQAFEYGTSALNLEPNDQRLINNLEFYKEKI
jgi:glycosyltransferase involved in cell wall biosynthesis